MQIYFDRRRYHCQDCGIEYEITRQTVNTEIWDNVSWDDVKHLETETCKICKDTLYCPPTWGVQCPQCKSKNTIELIKK